VNAVATPTSPLRRLFSVVLGLVRIDARRPASWLVAVATLAVIALAPGSRIWAAAGCGVLLALAAIGSLLRAPPRSDLLHTRLTARLAWPLVCAAAGAGIARLAESDATEHVVAAVAVAAGATIAVAAVVTVKWLSRTGSLLRREVAAREASLRGHQHLVGRSWGDAAAMASTLGAMAICYFLMPEHAGWYAVVATSWFTLLAVPAATIVGGDQRLRCDLVAAGPGRPRLTGTPMAAVPTLATYAAVLGWPAAVAAIVAHQRAWDWRDPLAALLLLVCMAAVASGLAWASAARRWREETTLAVMAAAHATAIALAARVA
jgi:hypothetical protein